MTANLGVLRELFSDGEPHQADPSWHRVVQTWLSTAVSELTPFLAEIFEFRDNQRRLCNRVWPSDGQEFDKSPSKFTQLFLSMDPKVHSPWWHFDGKTKVFGRGVERVTAEVTREYLLTWIFTNICGKNGLVCPAVEHFMFYSPVRGGIFETLRIFERDLVAGSSPLPEDALSNLLQFYTQHCGVWQHDSSHLPPSLGIYDLFQSRVDDYPIDKGTMATPHGTWLTLLTVRRSLQYIDTGDWNSLFGHVATVPAPFEEVIQEIEHRFADKVETTCCERIVAEIQAYFSDFCVPVTFIPFGSTQTGMAMKGSSDLDVCIKLASGERMNNDRMFVGMVMQHLAEANRATGEFRILRFEAVHASKRSFVRLNVKLENYSKAVEMIPECCFDTNLINTQFFALCFRHTWVLSFMRLLRIWVQTHCLNTYTDPDARKQTLNNYFWYLAALCGLHAQGILPYFADDFTEEGTTLLREPPSLLEAFRKFLEFFSNFDFANRLMDIRAPGWWARDEFIRIRTEKDQRSSPAGQRATAERIPSALAAVPLQRLTVGICTYAGNQRKAVIHQLHAQLSVELAPRECGLIVWRTLFPVTGTFSDREETAILAPVLEAQRQCVATVIDTTLKFRKIIKVHSILREPVVVLVPRDADVLQLIGLLELATRTATDDDVAPIIEEPLDLSNEKAEPELRTIWAKALRCQAISTVKQKEALHSDKFRVVEFSALDIGHPSYGEFSRLRVNVSRYFANPAASTPAKLIAWLQRANELRRHIALEPAAVVGNILSSLDAAGCRV